MIALGSDHGGFALKEEIKKHLTERGIPFTDYGTGFLERSRELFEMEMHYYPESMVFIKPLAERLFRQ